MRELVISENESGQRLDKFLKKYMRLAPASFIYKMIRKKNIVLNGARASGSEMLASGDKVKLFLSDETISKFREKAENVPRESLSDQENIKKAVIYEDGDFIFLNKPADMLSQPGKSGVSVADVLTDYLLAEGALTAADLRAFRPAPANRLDRNTSGLILCGKTLRALQFLSAQLGERTLRKDYLVLVEGCFDKAVRGKAWYSKDDAENRVRLSDKPMKNGVQIETAFTPYVCSAHASLVAAELITGKSHQIRAHLAYLGHPVLGDPKYGDRRANEALAKATGVRRQMLHAASVTFPDEIAGPFGRLAGKEFSAPVPEDMRRAAGYAGFAPELLRIRAPEKRALS